MIQRILGIFFRQLYLLRRAPHRIVGMFYWVTMELFLWGLLTVYLNQLGGPQLNLVTVLLSGLIFWDFFMRAQQSLSVSFLEDVWVRNVGNVFASPIRPAEYLLGLILVSASQALASLTFVSVLAWLLWHLNIFQYGFWLVPFMANLFLTGWVLGIFAIALTLRLGPSSEIITWALPVLFQPLSAVFYPVSVLPVAMQVVAYLLPTTYIFEGMRSIVLDGSLDGSQIWWALGLNGVYMVVAILFFSAAYRSVRRRGTLQRYSD